LTTREPLRTFGQEKDRKRKFLFLKPAVPVLVPGDSLLGRLLAGAEQGAAIMLRVLDAPLLARQLGIDPAVA
jgi:hypothetical protein